MARMHLVVFDCDGTLVDSQHIIVAAMTAAFDHVGRVPLPRSDVLSIVGLSLPLAIARLLPDAEDSEIHAISDAYRHAFRDLSQHSDNHEPLYEGIAPLLASLTRRDDVLLGIATGKSRRGVDRILQRYGLETAFQTIQTADDHPSKPHPAMLEQALVETGSEPDRAVIIGDTTFDVSMGRAAGMSTFGVAWGYHSVGELRRAGADAVFYNTSSLHRALDNRFAEHGGESPPPGPAGDPRDPD